MYRLPFYVCKYCAILCWYVIVGSCKSLKLIKSSGKNGQRMDIVHRSCCVHHVSTTVEHNSCEVRPEEEE